MCDVFCDEFVRRPMVQIEKLSKNMFYYYNYTTFLFLFLEPFIDTAKNQTTKVSRENSLSQVNIFLRMIKIANLMFQCRI